MLADVDVDTTGQARWTTVTSLHFSNGESHVPLLHVVVNGKVVGCHTCESPAICRTASSMPCAWFASHAQLFRFLAECFHRRASAYAKLLYGCHLHLTSVNPSPLVAVFFLPIIRRSPSGKAPSRRANVSRRWLSTITTSLGQPVARFRRLYSQRSSCGKKEAQLVIRPLGENPRFRRQPKNAN